MVIVNKEFQTRIRLEMAKRGLSQREFAEKLDCKPQYLSRVLKGEQGKLPKIWQKIFDELDLSIKIEPDFTMEHGLNVGREGDS